MPCEPLPPQYWRQNLLSRPSILADGTIPGTGTDLPNVIIPLAREAVFPRKTIHYKDRESKEDRIDRHKLIETVDRKDLEIDWRDSVNI